jgi:hypothetical protein
MEDEREIKAVVEEFTDSDEEIQCQIKAEWDRKYKAGEVIREGEAAQSVALDWFARWGTVLERIIRRPKG